MKTICIAGKNDISVNVLLYCIKNYSNIRILAICNKDDSGVNGWQKSYLWFARKYGIEIVELKDVYEIKDLIFLSVEFDRIIRPEKFVSKRLFNIHFSLLPEYKGCYTSVLPILHGRDKTGVTFHKIDRGIDTGEIIEQCEVEIHSADTSYDLYKRLIKAGTDLVIKNLIDVLNGYEKSIKQDAYRSSYYSIKEIDFGKISLDTNATAFQMQNQIRAFGFRPYQLLGWNNNRYIECKVLDNRSVRKPGTLLLDTEKYSVVSSIDYDVKLYKDVLDKLLLAIKEGDNDYAKLLCESNKIINAQESHGWSPLIVAVYYGNKEMIEYLISRDADIHIHNWNGTTLLMYAKDYGIESGDWTVFRRLVSLGLDVLERDNNGLALSDYAVASIESIPENIRAIIGM